MPILQRDAYAYDAPGLHIWSAEGSFCIGAQNEKKVFATLSAIHLPNVHILEQAIRVGFKRGIAKLSGILQND